MYQQSGNVFVRLASSVHDFGSLVDTVLIAPVEDEQASDNNFCVDEYRGYFRSDMGIINLPMAEEVPEADIRRFGVRLVEVDGDTMVRIRKWLREWKVSK